VNKAFAGYDFCRLISPFQHPAARPIRPINIGMACFNCGTNSFRSISSAMAKAASAKLRQLGALKTSVDWAARAAVCETCPMRVVQRGVSYCGTPFLQQIDRDPLVDGCGCPTREKAKSPDEHCPVDGRFGLPALRAGQCNCRWCASTNQGITNVSS
jgi:hypothetical protein